QHRSAVCSEAQTNAPANFCARELRIRQHHMYEVFAVNTAFILLSFPNDRNRSGSVLVFDVGVILTPFAYYVNRFFYKNFSSRKM
ncbi:MAG: hypothetical protein J5795_02925, partial [Lachnospiraceae bacterium]|nr:hypothetical protein [Lachnospiraceae bacterium]